MAEEKRKLILSCIQPTGTPTLGNYIGAVRNWALLQSDYDCLYMVADLHSLTVRQVPADLRRRTRVGMGTCQGELCACRAAGLLGEAHNCAKKAKGDLTTFLNERWKGVYPVAWGDALRENEFTQWLYGGVCDMKLNNEEVEK